jgi:hypothetical protein
LVYKVGYRVEFISLAATIKPTQYFVGIQNDALIIIGFVKLRSGFCRVWYNVCKTQRKLAILLLLTINEGAYIDKVTYFDW